MDCNKQAELESNQPQQNQNRDRSRRCHSRLSDALALAFAGSVTELPGPVEGPQEQDTSELSPDLTESFRMSPELAASVRVSPELPASVRVSLELPASVRVSLELPASVRVSPEQPACVSVSPTVSARDRSRRSHSRLSDALAYAESLLEAELPESVYGSSELETSVKLSPEQVTSVTVSSQLPSSVSVSPEPTASFRDRYPRCHSRLSDALAYAESVTELPESVDRSSELETSVKLSPEQVASVRMSPELAEYVKVSPDLTASVRISPEQVASIRVSPSSCKLAVSDNTLPVDKIDHKRNLSQTSSVTAKIHLPTYCRLDIPEIDSALNSLEPSLFTMAYRNQTSPPPFTARPLPPIKGLQQENESHLKQLNADKQFEIKTEATESKSWDEVEKLQDHIKAQAEERQDAAKEVQEIQMEALDKDQGDDLKDGTLEAAENFLFVEPDQEETDGISDINVTETLTIVRERLLYLQRKGKLPQQARKAPKPPPRPKESIAVRETKASRLIKGKLQMQNEQPDMVQKVLPPVKTVIKHPAQLNTRSQSQLAPSSKAQTFSLNDYARRNSMLPPLVRETKASKLRYLKKMEDEKKSQTQREQERKVEFAFGQRAKEPFQRKRSQTPTFKPAPPKPYKKSGPVKIKGTRASILR